MLIRILLFLLSSQLLLSCISISPQTRRDYADKLANNAGWQKRRLSTDHFVLTTYSPSHISADNHLTVYIEEDGLAWLTRSKVSSDPTPQQPIGLELAIKHPQGNVAYLSRPCQFTPTSDTRGCLDTYWTDRRYSPEVIEAMSQAINQLKQSYQAEKITLVGYSGGGTVAALLASRRDDVNLLVTIASNLDHKLWTTQLKLSPLSGSLNPADEWVRLIGLPQFHFVGKEDIIVNKQILNAYLNHFPPNKNIRIKIIPGFDHNCCWIEAWTELVNVWSQPEESK